MPTQYQYPDIPTLKKANRARQYFLDDDATTAEVTQQPNKKYLLVAVYPDGKKPALPSALPSTQIP